MMKRHGYWRCLGVGALLSVLAAAGFAQAAQAQASRSAGSGGGVQYRYTQPRYAGSLATPQPSNGRGREISDQDHAQTMIERREVLPLGVLLEKAQKQGKGEFLGVEPDIGSNLYRFKFMRADGKVVWVDVNARSGQILSVR